MILGLDVGGTRTDSVLIQQGRVVAESKTPTGDDLLETLSASLDRTIGGFDPDRINRMVFSTTMATNAIAQGKMDPAGVIVSAGPGIDPALYGVGPSYHVVPGCIDHQGFEAASLDRSKVMEAAAEIKRSGIDCLAAVGKFSVRNPIHERQIHEWTSGQFSRVALGHRVSGALNFPRRISTAYLNAALSGIHDRFLSALAGILHARKLRAPLYLLKPDGGTCEPETGQSSPSTTAQSGPAASVMGALALDGCPETTLVLDIGGTTTDMSVVLDGVPLLDPVGIPLGPYMTLIRSLITHSAGIGGDSSVKLSPGGTLSVGPFRDGPAAAFGGQTPTPTDAMIVLGLMEEGDETAAYESIGALANRLAIDRRETARLVMESAARRIADEVGHFVARLNNTPVYTIYQVLHDKPVTPSRVVIIGGPAPQFAPFVAESLNLPCSVPEHYGVANAVGSAVSRLTTMVTLQADTERGTVTIPEIGVNEPVPRRFDLDKATVMAEKALHSAVASRGGETGPISVVERQCFSMVRGYSLAGRNIRLKMCITPGLTTEWTGGK